MTIHLVPDDFSDCGSPLQVVANTLRYFTQHYREPLALRGAARAMGVTDDCLNFSFDAVRGMTPAQALLEHRLNQLFAALTDHPRQGLGRAIRACGLEQTSGVVSLFEQTFGIDMPLFLLTCRRAAEDRHFRRSHPDCRDLVLPP